MRLRSRIGRFLEGRLRDWVEEVIARRTSALRTDVNKLQERVEALEKKRKRQ
jgi:polyhydroxyalkanoate synthesis regulator phasin